MGGSSELDRLNLEFFPLSGIVELCELVRVVGILPVVEHEFVRSVTEALGVVRDLLIVQLGVEGNGTVVEDEALAFRELGD